MFFLWKRVESEHLEHLFDLARYDPDDRILARQALRDPYFRELHEMKKEAWIVYQQERSPRSRTITHSPKTSKNNNTKEDET